jgi:hypothetical protein
MGLINSLNKKLKRRNQSKNRKSLVAKYLNNVFPDKTVQHGPFRGLIYPGHESVCSSIFPKLLGSYEKELTSVIERICKTDYSEIIDIGCAEGYYAVGLARRIESAKIYAYDTDKKARTLCSEMARLNGIKSSRFFLKDFCSTEDLASFTFTGKGLILCDCEGYEKDLFSPEIPELLKNHDLLIETHDCIDIEISSYLFRIFSKSHNVESILSTDDIQKAKTYEFDELKNCTLAEKKILLSELRSSIMEWFFITAKERKE